MTSLFVFDLASTVLCHINHALYAKFLACKVMIFFCFPLSSAFPFIFNFIELLSMVFLLNSSTNLQALNFYEFTFLIDPLSN